MGNTAWIRSLDAAAAAVLMLIRLLLGDSLQGGADLDADSRLKVEVLVMILYMLKVLPAFLKVSLLAFQHSQLEARKRRYVRVNVRLRVV